MYSIIGTSIRSKLIHKGRHIHIHPCPNRLGDHPYLSIRVLWGIIHIHPYPRVKWISVDIHEYPYPCQSLLGCCRSPGNGRRRRCGCQGVTPGGLSRSVTSSDKIPPASTRCEWQSGGTACCLSQQTRSIWVSDGWKITLCGWNWARVKLINPGPN